jgi:large subunit ribosomal protein L24
MSGKLHVRKGDNVYILTGKNRGQSGRIIKAFPEKGRVLVQGVNMIKKHKKPQRNSPGGIMDQEAAVHVSNVMLICEKCKSPTKIGRRLLENGEKVRFCKKCNEIIDTIVSKEKES